MPTFDCNVEGAIPEIVATAHGEVISICVDADPGEIVVAAIGTQPDTVFIASGLAEIVLEVPTGEYDVYADVIKTNWVKWSNIGEMNFTINRANVAGEMPMDWDGWAYSILKLGDKPVVYGKNGVSLLPPSGKYYGLVTIYRIGLKSKQAITGDNSIHFFVDNKDQLIQHSGEGLKLLDYSEYLSDLTSPVLSYDAETGFVYICDGTYGFVYSSRDGSLGVGPVNITGLSSKDGTLYVTAPAAISTPALEVWTDIYDMGTSRGKSIKSVEVRTDVAGALSTSIDYRRDKAAAFMQTDWYTLDERSMAYITCYGEEFRFGVKVATYEYLEVDSIVVRGEVHGN